MPGASLAGSGLMAGWMAALGLVSGWSDGLLVCVVGLVATLLESVLGATLQPRFAWLTNEVVNALQTLVAALLAMGLAPAVASL